MAWVENVFSANGQHTCHQSVDSKPQTADVLVDRIIGLQGYLAHKKHQLPQYHHRSLGIGLLSGPTGGEGSCERGTPVLACRACKKKNRTEVINFSQTETLNVVDNSGVT